MSPHSGSGIPAPAAPRYVTVAVDAKTSLPGDEFTYSIPGSLDLRPGHLVQVPFGRRSIRGVVTSLTDVLAVDYVKPVARLLHPEPLVDGPRMALARWIADYYMAPLFDALAPMLPPGWRGRARSTIRLVADAEEPANLAPAARSLLAYLRANPQPHQVAALVQSLGPWAQNAARALVRAGVAEQRTVAPAVRVPRSVRVVLPAVASADLSAYADDRSSRAPRQAELARRLARDGGPLMAADARAEYGASAVAALVREGVTTLGSVPPPEPAGHARLPQPPLLPTPEQSAALAAIGAALEDAAREPHGFLLQGVTGSGKTEVYLQSLARCLDLGKRAVVLVPELSLTSQMVERFEARFPGQVGVLHSTMNASEHWSQWWAVQRGERGVVVGTRSALFAPQPDLGLIIVDEEHEWTYKQTDASPRYHARDAAMELARLAGAVVVLGSATPDVVTTHAAGRGRLRRLGLPRRIERSGAPASMASVEVVDMRAELRAGNRGIFSQALGGALVGAVESGEQAVLFLNRRGAGSVVECRSCGHVMRCYRCRTPLTHHVADAGGGRGVLVCHHCNRRRTRPLRCPRCRSGRIRDLGLGTQRLVEEVRALIPSARVLRWDRDSASTAAAHARLLDRFASGEADVLVGTQMVAKGLDFPTVTLAGVVLADIGLHAPDFRAPERTFQLLTQVVGRAGRGATPGRAVIQTYVPEHYAVAAAARQDYESFYRDEMRYRTAQGNPPFGRLARLLFGHSDQRRARTEAQRLAGHLRRLAREWDMRDVDVVGAAPAYPPRVRGTWRWQVFLRAPDPRQLLDKATVPPQWTVDIDPVNV